MSRFALLLGKDLRLLARSRPLLVVLVVYPLVLSLLVGGVLGGQGTRPRVAFAVDWVVGKANGAGRMPPAKELSLAAGSWSPRRSSDQLTQAWIAPLSATA